MMINREIRDSISIRAQSTVRQSTNDTILHKCVNIFLIVNHLKMSYEIIEIEFHYIRLEKNILQCIKYKILCLLSFTLM